MIHYDFPLVPFLFATALSVNGLRKRSLSPSGAAAAFLTGISMLSMPLRTPGISLIVFYLIGSSATRAGKKEKALLEDGHDKAGAGYRNGMQVFSNSASALVAALLWGALHAPGFPAARQVSRALGAHLVNYTPDAWCPLDASANQGWSRALLMIVLGHFACCLGDTLASELGILSKTPPILLTTLSRVPPGTNGGLSLLGTVASISGGAAMGLTMFATLVAENSSCREQTASLFWQLLLLGAGAGGFGSLLDSLLGATLQRTQYSNTTKRILTDTSAVPDSKADIKVVSGFDILTNNQVNLVSSTLTALALGYVA
ncbi:hypothetical protein HETIRDRAFT_460821 [Heterobasidion irregulare TC 32-1]|uniref:Integral membrane protein DUF92-domain-containing protein n=1 Tax=Heterobasidion irregulare (strain TC 32-1) TaxID=747525 RepID=W4JSL6_HETIT|nr:uncharacterized protein HETIRDRAFT_460821 [Heterobasidion irregulare TC 32-1]ETW76557.1 hypothetical protein HETIRDRAFT_460821 [Heterobasidion irregulare TC 32-1]